MPTSGRCLFWPRAADVCGVSALRKIFTLRGGHSYTSAQQTDLDIKTSENMIGEIINLSQELNSLLWDKLNSGATFDEVAEIYYDTSMLDVMSGIEIRKSPLVQRCASERH